MTCFLLCYGESLGLTVRSLRELVYGYSPDPATSRAEKLSSNSRDAGSTELSSLLPIHVQRSENLIVGTL